MHKITTLPTRAEAKAIADNLTEGLRDVVGLSVKRNQVTRLVAAAFGFSNKESMAASLTEGPKTVRKSAEPGALLPDMAHRERFELNILVPCTPAHPGATSEIRYKFRRLNDDTVLMFSHGGPHGGHVSLPVDHAEAMARHLLAGGGTPKTWDTRTGQMRDGLPADHVATVESTVEPSGVPVCPPIMARVVLQAWVNDYAMEIDDQPEPFDVTREVLAYSAEEIRTLADDTYESDDIVSDRIADHNGPFRAEVEQELDAWCEDVLGKDRREITDEDLNPLRRRFGIPERR